MERYQEIEKSLTKTFHKTIWSKFVKAVKNYELISENDRIMVCLSGGKDSFLMAKCFQELLRHRQMHFEVVFVVMNPGYTKENLQKIQDNAKLLNIPIEIFNTDIFKVASKLNAENPCYMCARMRRGHLYNKAQELGCNKIALGHHFDDVIETTLLSLFYGAEIKTMLPKLHSDNFVGLELIRPLYLIKENDIKAWCRENDLTFLNCACDFTAQVSQEASRSKRQMMKTLIADLQKTNPDLDHNIFKALDNVNLNGILGAHKDKQYFSFLDNYDKGDQNE